MDCAFCDESNLKDRIIIENDLARAFPTMSPIVPGHVLIAPKRHAKCFEELIDEEREAIEQLRAQIKKALTSAFGAEGFNYAWNEEKVGGQSVPHFHLHVLPRKEGDAGVHQYEPRQFVYRSVAISDRPQSTDKELLEVSAQIRAALG